jgi:cellulose synthase (UDP-forming)
LVTGGAGFLGFHLCQRLLDEGERVGLDDLSTGRRWLTLLPAYFIFIFAGARIPGRARPLPHRRVAMVVTKAPSEPFTLVRTTLEGALAQVGYDHDTWLADEDPDRETLTWCRQHGVQVSSRKNDVWYHQPTWPRRTRCKEGNLAYFYDHFGYDRYDRFPI